MLYYPTLQEHPEIDLTLEVELMSSLAFCSAARDFTAVSGFMDKSDVEESKNELSRVEVEGIWGFMTVRVLVQVDNGGAGDLSVSGHKGCIVQVQADWLGID